MKTQGPQAYKVGDIVQQVAAWPGQVSNGMKVQVISEGIWDNFSGWYYKVRVIDGGLIKIPVGREFYIGEGPGYKVIDSQPVPVPTPAPPPPPAPVPEPPKLSWWRRLLKWLLSLF